jgi:hypothetical protein
MRIQERGIGNLAFIAAVLLFLIATALFFMKESEASDYFQKLQEQAKKSQADGDTIRAANAAYNEINAVLGANIAEVPTLSELSAASAYPKPEVIREKYREWLWTQAQAVVDASKVTLTQRRIWQIPEAPGVILVNTDKDTIQMYGSPYTKETMTVANWIAPFPSIFQWVTKALEEQNNAYEQLDASTKASLKDLRDQNAAALSKFSTDSNTQKTLIDQANAQARSQQDALTALSTKIETVQSEGNLKTEEANKKMREAERRAQAWEQRVRTLKVQNDRVMKENPKDGEVLVADARQGLVFINLGRKNKLSRGTKFSVWRSGKGAVRETVAQIQVIEVKDTSATCRILEADSRVPVTRGMNVSNPFYDPLGTIKVFVYGNLRVYPTDVARRRLAESGVQIMRTLDDTVNIIVLGEPPVSAPAEEVSDDPDAARLAEKRLSADRSANLAKVYDQAVAIGAIVVTEAELATFIDY